METEIVVALITAGLGLMGVIIRQVSASRKEETARHTKLDQDVLEIKHMAEEHKGAANEIGQDLKSHIAATKRANEINQDAHSTLFSHLARIEGWIEGRREER